MSQRGHGAQLASHLKSVENEKVSIISVNGALTYDISGAIAEFEGIAKGSNATKPFAHCIISPHPNEAMDEQKWELAWKVFEKIHGLSGYAHIRVEHLKNNRIHQHAVYNRIDPDSGKAINLSHTHRKNELVARLLEIEFGHSLTKGKHNKAVINELRKRGLEKYADKLSHLAEGVTPNALYTHKEHQMEKRGIPISKTRTQLAEAWLLSDTKEQFLHELSRQGYLVAQGEKVPIAISSDGREIPLLRAINSGLKSKNISRIKKAELSKMLPGNLALANEVTRNFNSKIKQVGADPTQVQNSISPATHTQNNKWRKYRKELLEELYTQETAIHLSQYWRVYQLNDGSLMLQNNAGRIIDRGNVIQSCMDNHELAAKTMIDMAIARGWEQVTVTGSDEFKREHFKYAQKVGLNVSIENEHDQQLWDSVTRQSQKPNHRTRHSVGLSLG